MSSCDIITLDDINTLSDLMMKQYELGVQATLDTQEEELLNKTTDYLNQLFRQGNIEFDTDGFKNFVKKLYPKNSTQFGGVKNKKGGQRFKFDYLDFVSILMLVASIFMLYFAYVKLDQIVNELTGSSVIDLTSQSATSLINSSPSLQETINTIQNLRESELTFLKVVINSFNMFCTETLDSVINDKLSPLVKKALMAGLVKTTEVCGLSVKAAPSGTGMLGTILNTLANSASFLVAPTETATCMKNESLRQFQSMIDSSSTQTIQIYRLIKFGVSIGSSSAGYLIKRLKDYRFSERNFNSSYSIISKGNKYDPSRPNENVPTIQSNSTSYPTSVGQRIEIPYSKLPPFSKRGGKQSNKYRKNKKTRRHKRKTKKNKRNL